MFKFILTVFLITAAGCSTSITLSVPDQFATIQSAVNAASPGDTVLVSPGVYYEKIKMKTGVILKSKGDDSKEKIGLLRAEKTIIDGSRSTQNIPGVEMAEGSVIDGFTVTGTGKYDEERWNKHFASKGEMQSHDHIGAPGIAGISARTHCEIINNTVHHIGYTGIALMGRGCTAKVRNNTCYRNMGGGIGSMRESKALIEANICYENFYAGIGHDNASPKVLNNICYGNIRAGIGISEGASPFVSGNQCYKNRRAGIGIRTGSDTRPEVVKNKCYKNGMAGIGIKDDARPIVKNNKCWKNKLAGIGSRNGAQSQIIGNECYENGQSGIGSMGSKNLIIHKNFCHNNKTAGIGFGETKNGKAEVSENRITDNALVAVGIHSGWEITLKKNEISRQGGMPPLIMIFKGSKAVFTQNTLNGGGVAAVRLAGEAELTDNKIIGNGPRAGGPPNFGVWALPGSKITINKNFFAGWRHALHASGSEVYASGNKIEKFSKTALVILQSSKPPQITDNTAKSADPKAQVLKTDSKKGRIKTNKIVQEK